MIENELTTSAIRLALAFVAGGMIGLERTYHGRPAGFRTHILVCTSSSLLMLLTVFQWQLLANAPVDTIRVDPTRMAQGIMTGIGFLGAGVIIKENLTVRGLTTAASIWLTASIGIVIGMGLFSAAFMSIFLALAVLTLFRKIEHFMPTLRFGELTVSFARITNINEEELRTLIRDHGFKLYRLSYCLENEGKTFKYHMTLRTSDMDNFGKLTKTLTDMEEQVIEFTLTPTGD